MTELLFNKNPRLTHFFATVVSIAEGVSEKKGSKKKGSEKKGSANFEVQLDRSAFYPEGGGQPADRGWIGAVKVLDVKKRGGSVVHIVDGDPGEGVLLCRIDWSRRFDFMQQHTGQHILSACLLQRGGYNTLSVRLGAEISTIEVDRRSIGEADARRVEECANRVIQANRLIRVHWTNDRGVESFPLRRPPKVQGSIRIVEVEGVDFVACGGVHVSKTGEVGLVKYVGTEVIRGHARLLWKIGHRAYSDYREKSEAMAKLVQSLSAPPREVGGKVDQLIERVQRAEWEANRAKTMQAALVVESLRAEARGAGEGLPLVRQFEGEERGFIMRVAKELVLDTRITFCLVNRAEDQLQWCIGIAEGITFDFGAVGRSILDPISGKGGGKPPLWQGIGRNPEGIEAMFRAFRSALEED